MQLSNTRQDALPKTVTLNDPSSVPELLVSVKLYVPESTRFELTLFMIVWYPIDVMVVLLSGLSSEPFSLHVTFGIGSPMKSISTCRTVPALMNMSFNGVFIFGFTEKKRTSHSLYAFGLGGYGETRLTISVVHDYRIRRFARKTRTYFIRSDYSEFVFLSFGQIRNGRLKRQE